jgi:hypothetical protein
LKATLTGAPTPESGHWTTRLDCPLRERSDRPIRSNLWGARHAAVLNRSSADSFFPASLLRYSHAGRRSRRSLFFGGSGVVLTSCGVPSAAWPAHTASVCRCSSRSKESITLSTSLATDKRKLLSSRASGTTAPAASVALQRPAMLGANAVAASLSRFLIPSISPTTRSRSRRSFSSVRRASNSAI